MNYIEAAGYIKELADKQAESLAIASLSDPVRKHLDTMYRIVGMLEAAQLTHDRQQKTPRNRADQTLHELSEALMYGDIIIERIPYRDSEDMPFWTYRAHFDGESVTESVERDTVEAAIRDVYEARDD